jgi:hypothetical protein
MRPADVLSRALKRAHPQEDERPSLKRAHPQEDGRPSLHGLPPDVKAIIADLLPLRSVAALHDTTSAHRGEFRPTQAGAFQLMWGLSNPSQAVRLAAHPALAALVGHHPIVVAGEEGWGTRAYSDRVTDRPLLAWAAANGSPWSIRRLKTVDTLVVPDGVSRLGDNAFNGATGLTRLTLPRSLMSIGEWACYKCTSLSEVNFSAARGLKEIDSDAFNGTALKSLTLPDSLALLGDGAFAHCAALESVTLPRGIRDLRPGVFSDCRRLLTADMSAAAGVTRLPDGLFSQCVGLTSVRLPPKLTHVGECAFRKCAALRRVQLPDTVTHIEHGAFSLCTSLAEVNFPDILVFIGAMAFQNCTGLATVRLPASVQMYNSSFAGAPHPVFI